MSLSAFTCFSLLCLLTTLDTALSKEPCPSFRSLKKCPPLPIFEQPFDEDLDSSEIIDLQCDRVLPAVKCIARDQKKCSGLAPKQVTTTASIVKKMCYEDSKINKAFRKYRKCLGEFSDAVEIDNCAASAYLEFDDLYKTIKQSGAFEKSAIRKLKCLLPGDREMKKCTTAATENSDLKLFTYFVDSLMSFAGNAELLNTSSCFVDAIEECPSLPSHAPTGMKNKWATAKFLDSRCRDALQSSMCMTVKLRMCDDIPLEVADDVHGQMTELCSNTTSFGKAYRRHVSCINNVTADLGKCDDEAIATSEKFVAYHMLKNELNRTRQIQAECIKLVTQYHCKRFLIESKCGTEAKTTFEDFTNRGLNGILNSECSQETLDEAAFRNVYIKMDSDFDEGAALL